MKITGYLPVRPKLPVNDFAMHENRSSFHACLSNVFVLGALFFFNLWHFEVFAQSPHLLISADPNTDTIELRWSDSDLPETLHLEYTENLLHPEWVPIPRSVIDVSEDSWLKVSLDGVQQTMFYRLKSGVRSLESTRREDAVPPLLIAPRQGWSVTDYALMFTWQRQSFMPEEDEQGLAWSIDNYQLQVARDRSFSNPSIDRIHHAPGQDVSRLEEGDEGDVEAQEIREMLQYWTETTYMPSTTLETGTWFWRVRAADLPDQEWSSPVSFEITLPGASFAPSRILSHDAPLFTFDMYDSDAGGWGSQPDWETYWGFFPEDLQPYVAFAIPHEGWGYYDSPSRISQGKVLTFPEFLEPLADLEIPVFIKTGGPDGDPQNYISTTELEYLYKNHPNVQGIVTGENTWQAIDGYDTPVFRHFEVRWLQNVIKLSGKHGKYVIAGEGAYDFAWNKYLGQEQPDMNQENENDYEWLDPQILKDHPQAFVPASKSNIFWSRHQMDSSVFGASVSNLVAHHGVWAEAWYWSDAGFSNGPFTITPDNPGEFSTMPFATWIQTMLMGVARGASVYHFGGESGVSDNRGDYDPLLDAFLDEDGDIYSKHDPLTRGDQYSSFWDMDGHQTLGFQRYIIPFIQSIVKHDMIPSKTDVRAEIKVAVDPGPVESDKGGVISYGHYATLYRNTYGIRDFLESTEEMEEGEMEESLSGCRFELTPNSGRYYFIPVIPHPASSFDLEGIYLAAMDELQDADAVGELFNAFYPDSFTGDAWMTRVGHRYYVTNSHENVNQAQSFGFTFSGRLQSFSGNSIPHSYLLASTDAVENSLWFHANAEHGAVYTDMRATRVTTTWTSEPSIHIIPEEALQEKSWDPLKRELFLSLSHAFGAVEVSLVCP
ncbi:MAG: hypothetical protein HOA47_07125 [Verrucomicrobia bacterium]|nr:hypothetical protein [Verrucomicrobiota bacterium]